LGDRSWLSDETETVLDERSAAMTTEPNSEDPVGACQAGATFRPSDPPLVARAEISDLISPVLYDLVMWGFAEENSSGQRVLRSDIQARLDGHDLTERELQNVEATPLYVGYRCQTCWEAAVTLVAYGQHLCAWNARPASTPRRPFVP
jgi:hypothetical protein